MKQRLVIRSLPQAFEMVKEMVRREESDRRNGSFSRHLFTELGDIELCVPRTQPMSAVEIVRAYRFLVFDGVVLKRRTGAGSVKRVVLVALGITDEGRKEVIDFTIAQGDSETAWARFLCDLYQRGLDGQGLEMIVADGGKGPLAALAVVYPAIQIQRCWAHKARNVLNYVRKADQKRVKADLREISRAQSFQKAQRALGHFLPYFHFHIPAKTHFPHSYQ